MLLADGNEPSQYWFGILLHMHQAIWVSKSTEETHETVANLSSHVTCASDQCIIWSACAQDCQSDHSCILLYISVLPVNNVAMAKGD